MLKLTPFLSDTRILDNNYSLLKTLYFFRIGERGKKNLFTFFLSNRQKIRCKITIATMRGRSSPLKNLRALNDLESSSFDTVSGAF